MSNMFDIFLIIYGTSGVEFAFGRHLILGMRHQLDLVLLHSWGHSLEVPGLGGL